MRAMNKNGQIAGPLFTYYGGKFRAAPLYPKPLYPTIIEPFAGAAGYSLRYPEHKIILVDRDPVIAATWRYLIRATPDEIRQLPNMPMDGSSVDDISGLIPEARYLIGWWLNKGTSAPCKRPSAWMREGLRPNSFWGPEVREALAQRVDRIKHWQIVEGDYTSVPPQAATWFVDPPYQIAGNRYRCHNIDYTHLAAWCRQLSGQTMVCEAEGASWLPFSPFLEIKANESRAGGKRSKEALWQNT